jgi:hypothetical protein
MSNLKSPFPTSKAIEKVEKLEDCAQWSQASSFFSKGYGTMETTRHKTLDSPGHLQTPAKNAGSSESAK